MTPSPEAELWKTFLANVEELRVSRRYQFELISLPFLVKMISHGFSSGRRSSTPTYVRRTPECNINTEHDTISGASSPGSSAVWLESPTHVSRFRTSFRWPACCWTLTCSGSSSVFICKSVSPPADVPDVLIFLRFLCDVIYENEDLFSYLCFLYCILLYSSSDFWVACKQDCIFLPYYEKCCFFFIG